METTLSHRLHVVCSRPLCCAQTQLPKKHLPFSMNCRYTTLCSTKNKKCANATLVNGLFSVLIKWMTEWMVALFHNTAWVNTSMLDGANPLDMIDLLATMPRGYDSNAHNGLASTLHWLFYLGLRAPAVACGPVELFDLAISSWKQCRVLFLLITRSRAPLLTLDHWRRPLLPWCSE